MRFISVNACWDSAREQKMDLVTNIPLRSPVDIVEENTPVPGSIACR